MQELLCRIVNHFVFSAKFGEQGGAVREALVTLPARPVYLILYETAQMLITLHVSLEYLHHYHGRFLLFDRPALLAIGWHRPASSFVSTSPFNSVSGNSDGA